MGYNDSGSASISSKANPVPVSQVEGQVGDLEYLSKDLVDRLTKLDSRLASVLRPDAIVASGGSKDAAPMVPLGERMLNANSNLRCAVNMIDSIMARLEL